MSKMSPNQDSLEVRGIMYIRDPWAMIHQPMLLKS